MKKTHLILFVIFSFSLLFSLPDKVNATFRASNGTGKIGIACAGDGCDSDSKKLQLVGYKGDLGISVYSRPFNFIRSDNGINLKNGNNIPVETKLNFSPYGNAIGTWWVTGKGYDTPDMGSGEHLIPGANTKAGNGRINVKAPITNNPISIVGRGAVSCNGWTCTANSIGNAWIDVIFAGSSVEATSAPKYPDQDSRCQRKERICKNIPQIPQGRFFPTFPDRGCENRPDRGGTCIPGGSPPNPEQQQQVCEDVIVKEDCGQDSKKISYSNQNITISFNVISEPNQAPKVVYTNTTNISYNTAKANWTYTDPDGDKLKSSHVQIATDQAFTNLVFNQSQENSSTNMNLSGLKPGTTYYPRVAAKDVKGTSSAWNNGPAFKTLANPVPNLADFSCGVSKITDSPAKYTTVKVNWNYTGSDPDRLILTLRYKKVSSNLFTSNNLTSSKTGTIDQSGLEFGSTYNVQISITDEFNRHITNQIKNCGDITLDSYPDPTVNFSLSNNNGTKTAQKGGQLTINPNDGVKALWNITDTFKLVANGCSIKTTDNNNPIRNDRIFDRSSLGFNNIISGNIPQNIAQDLKYTINLTCNGKPGFGGVKESINLVLSPNPNNIPPKQDPDPTPTVRCSLSNRSVSSRTSSIQLTANVGNVSESYDIKIGRNVGESSIYEQKITSIINNESVVTQSLDYTNLPFGIYRPWVEVMSNTGKKVTANCPTVTNFGDSQIKEVNP